MGHSCSLPILNSSNFNPKPHCRRDRSALAESRAVSWTPFLPEANHQAGPKMQRLSVKTGFKVESSMLALSCAPGPVDR